MTGGHKKERKVGRTRLAGEGSQTSVRAVEAREGQILYLGSPLNRASQTIVAKDNDLGRLDKEKEKHQQAYNRAKQRMREIGGTLWKDGV